VSKVHARGGGIYIGTFISGVAMFVGALVQNFGGGPFELPSIDKN